MKLLIVEDEYLISQLIINSLPWEYIGLEVIGTADDGQLAFQLVSSIVPDIIIMDLNIPNIHGIELSRMIRQLFPTIRIIILTGYSDFEYAREALNLGVNRFLLKPLDVEELTIALLETKRSILLEREEKHRIQQANNHITKLDIQAFMLSLLKPGMSEMNIVSKIQRYSIPLSPYQICVILIKIDHVQEKFHENAEVELWKFVIQNISEEIYRNTTRDMLVVPTPDHMIAIFVNPAKDHESDELSLLEASEQVLHVIRQYMKFTVTVGIGRCYNGFENVHQSFQEAFDMLERSFYLGTDQVLLFTDNEADQLNKNLLLVRFDQLELDIRVGNLDKAISDIRGIFHQLYQSKRSKEQVLSTIQGIFSVIVQTHTPTDRGQHAKLDADFQILLDKLQYIDTFQEIRDRFLRFLEYLFQDWYRQGKLSSLILVRRAKEFVESEYQNPELGLEMIAAAIPVNASYLSDLFKKETGSTIIDYIISYRLQKAKHFIESKACTKLSELAESVGYNDPYYFSKSFKKQFGVSPSDYIKLQ